MRPVIAVVVIVLLLVGGYLGWQQMHSGPRGWALERSVSCENVHMTCPPKDWLGKFKLTHELANQFSTGADECMVNNFGIRQESGLFDPNKPLTIKSCFSTLEYISLPMRPECCIVPLGEGECTLSCMIWRPIAPKEE